RTVQAKGLQLGLINISDIMTGLQLGIINKSCSLSGVQIGLFNIIENGPIPSMIGFNGRF
ncbi:MAG: LA_2272 family surface repeat-containing protein, partial [Candidatus Avelusimicrobium sp.]